MAVLFAGHAAATAVRVSGRGAVLVQAAIDADAMMQMSKVLNMIALLGRVIGRFKLVAKALHRVEFRASQKG